MPTLATLALEIAWDPTLRGILVVAVGIAVLCGSVYLLLATNTGARLGFLIAGAGLFGWLAIMAIAWWIYGIGYVGDSPTWQVVEVYRSEDETDMSQAATEAAREGLETWEAIPEGDPARGEAQAAADEALAGEDSPVQQFEDSADYTAIAAWERGGKDSSFVSSWLPLPHPTHYAMIQVRPVVEVDVPFGETPPPPEADDDAQAVSVIMERDLGNVRLPPFLVMVTSLLLFGIFCNVLHRRDKLAAATRQAAEAPA